MWTCNKGFCHKTRIGADFNGTALNLAACRLLCSAGAGIWPRPTGPVTISTDKPLVQLNVNDVDIKAVGFEQNELVAAASARFKNLLTKIGTAEARNAGGLSLVVELHLSDNGAVTELTLHTNETYQLTVTQIDGYVKAVISADNFFGARHGMESLSQVCKLLWNLFCFHLIKSYILDNS